MIRFLLTLSGTVFLGSIGAFLLYVPPMVIAAVSLATIVLLPTAIMLLFCFGIEDELQPMPSRPNSSR
jgi:hypothetical protein